MRGHTKSRAAESGFLHCRSDRIPLALSLIHAAAVCLTPSLPLIAAGIWWNSNTISHNFAHRPFFRSRSVNTVYRMFLTMLLGVPQSLWRERHLAHHRGGQSWQRPTAQIAGEILLVLALWLGLIMARPGFFFAVYLPAYALGLSLCGIHGYFEHAYGTRSCYGRFYNLCFLNDGYHLEHHLAPETHWTQLPAFAGAHSASSRLPPLVRWAEAINLEALEKIALRFTTAQRFLLHTHTIAIRRLLAHIPRPRRISIVGGGLFPRTALVFQRLVPEATITVIEARWDHIRVAERFLRPGVIFENRMYSGEYENDADLLVIPLAFSGNRAQIYESPPAASVLVHDWIGCRKGIGVIVSWLLLKRLNLVRG